MYRPPAYLVTYSKFDTCIMREVRNKLLDAPLHSINQGVLYAAVEISHNDITHAFVQSGIDRFTRTFMVEKQ